MLNREHLDYDYFYFLKDTEPGIGHNAPPTTLRQRPLANVIRLSQPPVPHDVVPEYTSSEALLYWYFKTKLRRDAVHGLPAIDRERYLRFYKGLTAH